MTPQNPFHLPNPPRTKAEIVDLLRATGPEQERLFLAARNARRQAGMDAVKLRGVIEVSNYCQKHCGYCAIRPQNQELSRYRMDAEQIVAVARSVADAGIDTVFLQSGQDPQMDDIVCAAIPRIRALGVDVLLNLGEKSRATYARYAAAGAGAYILKFETSDRQLHRELIHAPLAQRLSCAGWIKEVGMQLGTGNIIGLPKQDIDSVAEDLLQAERLRPDFVSASPFIPNEHTPLEHAPCGSVALTLNAIAISRLMFPHALIPTVSALEKLERQGQLQGLNAGANVMTVNFTPKDMRDRYAIYSSGRFVVKLDHAKATIEQAGLTPLTPLQ
jgi:biotin synthase